MNMIKWTILLTMVAFSAYAEVDNNPINAGTTQARNLLGRGHEASHHNPALLGVDRAPRVTMTPGLQLGIASWSDKLNLSLFNRYWVDSLKEGSALTTKILKRSFDLDGLSPAEVSDKLTKEFEGGVKVYYGLQHTLFSMGWNRIAFDITTHIDEETHIPEAPLMMLFSRTKGLLPGNTLDFSDLKQDVIWATDFSFHIGLPVKVPVLNKFFNLQYGAGGLGVKYVMGHSILKAETEDGTLTYNQTSNSLDVNGKVHVQTAGTGFHGAWDYKNPFESGLPVSGHGIGFDIGGILYDKKGTLSINFNNIGVLFWTNHINEATYRITKDSLDVYDIIDGIELADDQDRNARLVIFNRDKNEYLSMEDDSLKNGDGFATLLPLSLNIGYSYTWDFSKNTNNNRRWIAEYINAGANYRQQFTSNAGQSPIPRLSLGGEAGMVRGFVPVRLGFVFGGPELLASAIGVGFNFKYVNINASYKAVGTPVLIPKRGWELAGNLQVNWGLTVDTDKDGIDDQEDSCPEVPEDFDGFQDDDGCPDNDNDQDAVWDVADSCKNIPEDIDGFEDSDGCPDYDNDKDEVPDNLDKCPMEQEDKDNYRDEDGCPEIDNDGDGVRDADDKCPILAEDIDMFEDTDGCPEFDNDKDGVPDSVDNCMNEPEVFNGYKDNDGCPDTLIRPTEKETIKLNTKLRSINFKSGSAELITSSFAALDYIVGFLKQYPNLRYEIQGHTDSQGSDEHNLLLSAARASTVRKYLLSKGTPDSNLIAIGYGETVPVADNATANGRALNRRVQFRIVETNDEYNALKTNETLFQERIKDAKIKGY
jgi:outer membrane protein OmpA-like peptidoglycan-associated protein